MPDLTASRSYNQPSISDIRKILLDRIDVTDDGDVDMLSIEQCAVQLQDYFKHLL